MRSSWQSKYDPSIVYDAEDVDIVDRDGDWVNLYDHETGADLGIITKLDLQAAYEPKTNEVEQENAVE